MTTATVDRTYWLARLIGGLESRTAPFRLAATAADERATRLLDASVVLRPERETERERLRTATQDLWDITALLTRRIEAAWEIGGGTETVVESYATEYETSVKAWQDAVDAVLGVEQVTA
jgi:hypothetical protein